MPVTHFSEIFLINFFVDELYLCKFTITQTRDKLTKNQDDLFISWIYKKQNFMTVSKGKIIIITTCLYKIELPRKTYLAEILFSIIEVK